MEGVEGVQEGSSYTLAFFILYSLFILIFFLIQFVSWQRHGGVYRHLKRDGRTGPPYATALRHAMPYHTMPPPAAMGSIELVSSIFIRP